MGKKEGRVFQTEEASLEKTTGQSPCEMEDTANFIVTSQPWAPQVFLSNKFMLYVVLELTSWGKSI